MKAVHRPEIAATAGEPLESARAAVVMVHGRGDSAEGILRLAALLDAPGVAFVAPQASGNTWYPHSFLAPLESNQPWLDSALAVLATVLDRLDAAGLAADRVVLLGFSQGACLSSEFAARNARRYGGVVALSGGLIGPPGTVFEYSGFENSGTMTGTPVFFGCSDIDPHIPVERVHESSRVMADLGAQVEKRIYPGMGHTVNEDEIEWVRSLLAGLAQ